MPPLRIGVNALYLIPGHVGGTEIYLRHLLPALAEIDARNRYFVFLNRETGPDLVPKRGNFSAVRCSVSASFRPARLLWEQTMLPVSGARLTLDVLFNAGFTAPVLCRCPQVTVFHDLQHKRHPEFFRWWDLPFWRIFLFGAARVSRLLLASSEATCADLLRLYQLPPDKVRLALLGVDPAFFRLKPCEDPRDRYLLCVSTLHPHKNLDSLLRAFAEFRRDRPEFRLVMAGLRGFHTTPLERLCGSLGLDTAVTFTGWVPREDLYDLYARAAAFIYPSTFEGFGMPVLEAMAAGLPTACSRIEPLATNVGQAALLFDPRDEGAIRDAMVRLTSDQALRASLSAAGRLRAEQFSWTETARATLDAITSAARA